MAATDEQHIRAQPGPQRLFLRTPADIAIYGGAAGGGKSFALMLEALRNIHNPKFNAVLFRRTTPEITNPGGLWDESCGLYPLVGGRGLKHTLRWTFPSGATVKFAHMENDKDRFRWQGSQVTMIGWDEVSHFSAAQFWYMLGRNRSTCGVKPYMRATTNPDPDSFVAKLVEWWIHEDTGLAIPERAGVLRWFARRGDELVWGDSPEDIKRRHGLDTAKSLTFIPASVADNKLMLAKDPGYLANLNALPLVDRERLLRGNWKIRPVAGNFFRREWFEVVDAAPPAVARVRFWDRAATQRKEGNSPDYTAGALVSRDERGLYYVEDVRRMQESPHRVEQAMATCASQDGTGTRLAYAQDPGSAGVNEAQATARALAGYDVRYAPVTGDKQTMAKPVSSQAEAGNIKLVRGRWNEDFLAELENFPHSKNDDQVDALSGAFAHLTNQKRPFIV